MTGQHGLRLMLRLLAHSYRVPPDAGKSLAVDLLMGLMRAVTCTLNAPHVCRQGHRIRIATRACLSRPRGDSASLPPGTSARRFFVERLAEMAAAATPRPKTASTRDECGRIIAELSERAERGFASVSLLPPAPPMPSMPKPNVVSLPAALPTPTVVDGVDTSKARI